MIINTYKAYTARTHDGYLIVARRISASGWVWFRSNVPVSPEISEEHLKNFSMIVQGSMREGWATETVYEISDENNKGEEVNG